jgi:multidrug efflux pump subunit AcrB
MLVVYLFLGSVRRTLIIGSAIPIAMLVTFMLMAGFGLTFNIMTLGGLALGIGMLVDSTIVMLENVYRHQRRGEPGVVAASMPPTRSPAPSSRPPRPTSRRCCRSCSSAA